MTVRIHIERLVLDGLPLTSAQGPAVQAAMEAELGRLIQSRGIGEQSGGAVPRVTAPAVRLGRETPTRTGERIAASVYRGLGTIR